MKYLIVLIYSFLTFSGWSQGRIALEADTQGLDKTWTIYQSPLMKTYLCYGFNENPWPVAGFEMEYISLGPLKFQGLVNLFSSWDSLSPGSGLWKEKSGWFLKPPEKTWNRAGGALRIPLLNLSLGGRLEDGGGGVGLLFTPWKEPQISGFLELISRSRPLDLSAGFYEPQDASGMLMRAFTGGNWTFPPWIFQSWSLGSVGPNKRPGLAVLGYLGFTQGDVAAAFLAAWATQDFLGLEYHRKKMLGGMIKFTSGGFTGVGESSWELLSPQGPQGFLEPSPMAWDEVFSGEQLIRALGRFSQREKLWGSSGSLQGKGSWGILKSFNAMVEIQGGPENLFASVKAQISGGQDESPSFLSVGAEAQGALGDLATSLVFPGFSLEKMEAQGHGNLHLGDWRFRISVKWEIIPAGELKEATALVSWEF